MSDEYIFEVIAGELEMSCPGERGCHGCQSWCPLCGDVKNVCDYPTCDAHLRPSDIEKKIERTEAEMSESAAKARKLEILLLEKTAMRAPGANPDAVRILLRQEADWYRRLEADAEELEGDLGAAVKAGDKLWPRAKPRPGEEREMADPRQLMLFPE